MAEPGLQVPGIPAPPLPPELQKQHAQQGQQIIHLNWSQFKPEFSGKPEEDIEAHLLLTNDWMNTHHIVQGV